MAGSPKKRAAREAAEREKNMAAGAAELAASSSRVERVLVEDEVAGAEPASLPPTPEVSVPLKGEVLPPIPVGGADPTRTALKRAMRARAQEHAEAAIAVLVVNLKSPDARIATAAANDLLAWGFGKPATEIEAGDGAQMIVIRRFGEDI